MNLEDLVQQWHAQQPHPRNPSITVGDYPVAARMATVLKFGQGHASPLEVGNFWAEFKQVNERLVNEKKLPIAPDEFVHLVKQMAPVSFSYHGRPPAMHEIAKLRDADPKAVTDYFGALPDQHYQTVPAGEMARHLTAARPWARMFTGEEPTKLDAAYLYHSGQNPRNYYQTRSQYDAQDQGGGHPGDVGPGDVGGQPPQPRAGGSGVARGPAAPGGGQGVPS